MLLNCIWTEQPSAAVDLHNLLNFKVFRGANYFNSRPCLRPGQIQTHWMQSDQLWITLHFVGTIASNIPPKTDVSNTMDRSGISEETLRDHFSRALTQTHAEILVSGSMAELPLAYVFKNITDIDLMDIPTDIVALEIDDYLAFQGREQPVVIINSDSSPGLVHPCIALQRRLDLRL